MCVCDGNVANENAQAVTVVRILVAVELEAVVVVEGEEAAVAVVAVDGWVSTNEYHSTMLIIFGSLPALRPQYSSSNPATQHLAIPSRSPRALR